MNAPGNPFEMPVPRGIRLLQATLRVGVAVQCLGMALSALHHRRTSSLLEFWNRTYELGADRALQLDQRIAWGLIIAGGWVLLRPSWCVLVPLGIYQLALAVTAGLASEASLPLTLADQACRYALPWGLLLIDFWPPLVRPSLTLTLLSVGLLRGAAAAASISWGISALEQFQRGGPQVEQVSRAVQHLLQIEMDSASAPVCLAVMGTLEIAWAICLLVSRNRVAAAWMAGWGFCMAFLPILAEGQAGYDLSLMRFGDGAAPLTVLLFWMFAVQESSPRVLPEPGTVRAAGPAPAPRS